MSTPGFLKTSCKEVSAALATKNHYTTRSGPIRAEALRIVRAEWNRSAITDRLQPGWRQSNSLAAIPLSYNGRLGLHY